MASHQQDHHDNVVQLNGCCRAALNSLLEENKKLKAEKKVLEEKFEKMEGLIIEVRQMFSLNRPPSTVPSNASLLPHQAQPSASTSYRLCFNFEGDFPDTFRTKTLIEDVVDSPTVELFDHTGKRVEVGPGKNVKVKFLVLDGGLKDDFTEEDFNKYIVKPRDDKPALLKGNCEVSLSNGSARVSGFSFTDNSNAMRNGRFRLGAQLTNVDRFGPIARPAVSPPFKVKEKRPEDDQKHPTPSPTDELFHLRNIGKKGPYYKKALENDVKTVLDFLRLNSTDPGKLKTILGIKGAKWKEIVDNAKKCNLTNECYTFKYHDDASGDVLHLKCDFEIESVSFKGQTSKPYESLDNSQKEKAGLLRKAAYKKRKELERVNHSTNQKPPAHEAAIEYLGVEQEERGELEEQPAPAPAPAPAPSSNIYPNVPDAVGLPAQICSNPAADHDNSQQDIIMIPSASLTANAYGVQHTAMETVFHGTGFDWQEIFDMTPYQGEYMQLMDDTIIGTEDMMSSPNFSSFMEHYMIPSSPKIGFMHMRWCCIIRLIRRLICWRRRIKMGCRPGKKQKNH